MAEDNSATAQSTASSSSTGGNSPPTEGIEHPGINDVMFGRGGDTNYHIGNHRFRVLADEHRQEYRSASRKEKALVVQEVVRCWRARGGRFLAKTDPERGDESLWHDVGDTVAKKKAAKILSEKAPKKKANKGSNDNNSGNRSRKRPAVDSLDADRTVKQPVLQAAAATQTTVAPLATTATGASVAASMPTSAAANLLQAAVQAAPGPTPQLPGRLPLTTPSALSQSSVQQSLNLSLGGGLPFGLSVRDLLALHRNNPHTLAALTSAGLTTPELESRLALIAQALAQHQVEQDAARYRALMTNALLLNNLSLAQTNQLLAPAPTAAALSREQLRLLFNAPAAPARLEEHKSDGNANGGSRNETGNH